MGIDQPNREEKNDDKGDKSTEQASERLIEDKNKVEQKPAGPASVGEQSKKEEEGQLKVLPRIDMYGFHQGSSNAASGERGLKLPDAKVVDEKPADEKPAAEKPVVEKPANPAEKPAENKIADDKAVDAKTNDAKAEETQPKDGLTKAEEAHLKAVRERLEKENFNLKAIQKNWGPYQSLEAMVKEGKLKMSPAEMKKEAERIRDREFKALGRKHFNLGESPKRWSEEEMDNMVKDELKTFRAAEEKRVAAEKKAEEDRVAAERKAEEERQRAESEKQLRDQTAVALEKHVPAQDKLQSAAKGIGLNVSDEQMKEFRERLKEHTFKEVARGTMKPEDLERPMPRVGGVFVAMGAVKEEQLNQALQKQEEMRKAGQKPPQLGDMLKEQFKDNKEALMRLDIASKFYDKLYEEVTGKPRVAPPAQTDQKPPQEKVDPKLKVRR